jgi:hypothetical protein
MPDSERFWGLWFLSEEANALRIVCLGIDSTDRVFLRCVNLLIFDGRVENIGEAGNDAESLGEFWPTVVAAENDDSEGSLSTSHLVFNGPS